MNKRVVGKISESEKEEVIVLTERLSALKELRLGIDNLDLNEIEIQKLLSKVENREVETSTDLQKWWNDKYIKYHWEGEENASWEVDFHSSNVLLVN